MNDDFFKLSEKRYSVRKFLNKPLEQDKIDKILQAAMIAPMGCNYQAWRILVINSEESV